jgi:hypothetical protein
MKTILSTSLLILLLTPVSALASRVPDSALEWARFTKDLAEAGLPARFITLLPTEFVQLEFADLRTAAAEYHPTGHRMVFHLALSENHEGRRFRPVRDISNHELATMYHELFHAYFDYLDFAAGSAKMPEDAVRIRTQATQLLACRYTVVDVVSGPGQKARQRKIYTEHRRLSESEGWDALNETWGVFVGWAIWNKLEVTNRFQIDWDAEAVELFWNRLSEAHEDGTLTGYFEPADPQARQVLPRLYMARSSAISVAEIALLLEGILEESPGIVRMTVDWIAANQPNQPRVQSCES